MHRDFVELRHRGRCIAVIDRDGLREWLTQPISLHLAIDDVMFTRLTRGYMVLSINGGGVWTLTPAEIKTVVVRL
jgi:hypothetical protein